MFSPRIQPRSLWASVAHVFVATSRKALCSLRPSAPVRTAAVPGLLARPPLFRRRHQLSCQQPRLRSWPGLSSSRAVDGAAWGRRLSTLKIVPPPQPSEPSIVPFLKARGPSCLQPRAWRRSLVPSRLLRRRFAPPCRARSRQLRLRWRAIESTVTPARRRCAAQGLGWTPSRPSATSIESNREEPSGLKYLDGVLGNGEGAHRCLVTHASSATGTCVTW